MRNILVLFGLLLCIPAMLGVGMGPIRFGDNGPGWHTETSYLLDTTVGPYTTGANTEEIFISPSGLWPANYTLDAHDFLSPRSQMMIPPGETWTLKKISAVIYWNTTNTSIGDAAGTAGYCTLQYCQNNGFGVTHCGGTGSYLVGAYLDIGPDAVPACNDKGESCSKNSDEGDWTAVPIVSTAASPAWFNWKVIPESGVQANCTQINSVLLYTHFSRHRS